ncbi:MAG: response regulator transcription factor [Elusimicrobiota bacterium]
MRSRRILIVDDDPGMRAIMRRAILSRVSGVAVCALSSPDQVLEIAGVFRPEVIVLDWVLGHGKTGVSLCREIKSKPWTRRSSILIISGQCTRETDGLRGMSCGADAYLAKPFAVGRFIRYVQALLKRSAIGGPRTADVLLVGRWLMDRKERRLIAEHGGSACVPPSLFHCLWILGKRYPRAVPVAFLIRHVWKNHVRDAQAAVAILRLKKYLHPKDGAIEAVPGQGYRLISAV